MTMLTSHCALNTIAPNPTLLSFSLTYKPLSLPHAHLSPKAMAATVEEAKMRVHDAEQRSRATTQALQQYLRTGGKGGISVEQVQTEVWGRCEGGGRRVGLSQGGRRRSRATTQALQMGGKGGRSVEQVWTEV